MTSKSDLRSFLDKSYPPAIFLFRRPWLLLEIDKNTKTERNRFFICKNILFLSYKNTVFANSLYSLQFIQILKLGRTET